MRKIRESVRLVDIVYKFARARSVSDGTTMCIDGTKMTDISFIASKWLPRRARARKWDVVETMVKD
jgi:hypothetical protein